ncbi:MULTISPECIES: DUF6171 family protein [Enterococcus]|jgi:hypothetical protein|uniref:DUF6171 family protein n=2 Tax=Enterococcus casseliflavus TaxID=37734 RepID=A0AAW8UJB4_ENTCA|nr:MULTISPECIES: DUF6171 family protein [Enterococcus]AYJ43851.1 hypothetical protein D8N35_01590 [Enterococcus casseliflavus]EEV29716.1 predicted protein [Enterococcus casseliflavus EC30]EEV35739.1 predicted protein [Enterococcus casseliflavus EC10]MBE6169019.1 hypothetical protein [Enterococcus casseliflavus]MBE9907934.1 hypothetical protein [Enterococcus casseliflavus]
MTCKGCEVKDAAAAAQEDIESLIAEQLSLESDLASPEIVSRRIAVCETCPLRLNHTCTKCGCFYRFRANLAKKNCPAGMWEQTGQLVK